MNQANVQRSGKPLGGWKNNNRLIDKLGRRDSQGKYIRPASKDAKPSDYLLALHAMGSALP